MKYSNAFLKRTNEGFDIFNKITNTPEGAVLVQDKVEEMTGERVGVTDAVRHLAFCFASFHVSDPNRYTIMEDKFNGSND